MVVIQGIALFACIPLVLWLFLVQPLGPARSLALGAAVMLGHRFAAAPWAVRHARERCLWCGRLGAPAHDVPVTGAAGIVPLGACTAAHADLARRFFGFTARYRVPIALGIFVPLIVLLGGTLVRALGLDVIAHPLNALVFRVVVAATVVTASFAYASAAPAAPARAAFPVHNLVLLGIRNTLWVFRLVGGWWLMAAAVQAWRAAGR
jgi:hypothetical protein